jgi:putative ABC transport system permease protein
MTDKARHKALAHLAWVSLFRGDRLRLWVAVFGIGVAFLTVFLHLALRHAVSEKSTQIYRLFSADAVVLSLQFQFAYSMGDFPNIRLRQVAQNARVEAVVPVRIGRAGWQAEEAGIAQGGVSRVLVLGLSPSASAFVADAEIRSQLDDLRSPRQVLFDRLSSPDMGSRHPGDMARLNNQSVRVAGAFSMGLPIYAPVASVVSADDFPSLLNESAMRAEMGLIRMSPGASLEDLMAELRTHLPDDIQVLTMPELMARERSFFLETKPLGIIVRFGLLIGLAIGAVALFQAISTQMETRRHDLALLRIIGFPKSVSLWFGGFQLLLLLLLGWGLSILMAWPLFAYISALARMDIQLDSMLIGQSLIYGAVMLLVAGQPLWRSVNCSPAEFL